MKIKRRLTAVMIATGLCLTPVTMQSLAPNRTAITANAEGKISINDLPSEYRYAVDWIWENRILNEDSTGKRSLRWNSLYDQIIDGKGTINYVVRWQSHKTITLEQRKQFETLLSDAINDWNKWLAGYEEWPYEHINVKIVGWAVLDESCLLDRQPDEIVYTNLTYYDSQYDTSNGYETIPDQLPNAPDELSRMEHFADKSYQYPGGADKRFDMYMWATEGFPAIGGCGGDWGQRLSDTAYLNMLDGSGIHVLEHELGHCFGMTDFYGGEGESDGFPPGGFPGGENSLMMAGSASKITDFDGWMLRYIWTQIKDYEGRFDLSSIVTETTTTTTTTTTTSTTTTTTTTTTQPPVANTSVAEFTDTISDVSLYENSGSISFAQSGVYTFSGNEYYSGDESKNLMHYETGDIISVKFTYNADTAEIINIEYLNLEKNIHKIKGDVNADGEFSVADLVAMQKWLLAVPDISLDDWKAGDFSEDDILDVFDLCLMRQELLNQQN